MKTIYIITCEDELTTLTNKAQIREILAQYGVYVDDETILRKMYNTMNAGDAYTQFASETGDSAVRVYQQTI